MIKIILTEPENLIQPFTTFSFLSSSLGTPLIDGIRPIPFKRVIVPFEFPSKDIFILKNDKKKAA